MNILLIDREISMVGSSVVMGNLARELAKKGHTVTLCGMFRTKGHPDVGKADVLVPSFPSWMLQLHWLVVFVGPLFLLWTVLQEAKKYDVLMAASTPTHWIAVLVGKLYGKRVIWNCFEPWIAFSFEEIPSVGLATWFAGVVARSPLDTLFSWGIDQFVVLDKKNKKRVKQYYKRQATVVYPGVDYEFFSKGSAVKGERVYGKKQGLVLGCVGRLSPMKNQAALIDAIALVKKKFPKIHLFLVGEGPTRQQLEQQVHTLHLEKQISFVGHKTPTELKDFFAYIDVLVFPAVRQTWGLTPFEAACVGTPSIVSDDCGAAEVIGGEQVGLTTTPTPQQLAKHLLMLSKKSVRERFGKRAKAYVASHMTWEQYAREMETVL